MSRARNIIKLAIAAFAAMGTSPAVADTPYFAAFGLEKLSASISDSTFESYSLAVQAGHWIKPGVGMEVGANIPVNDDTIGSVNFAIEGLYTAGIRLEGPMASRRGTAAFVVAGFASAKIDAVSNFDQASDWYHGYFATAGLLVGINKTSQVSVKYSYHAVDAAIRIPAVQLGYRLQF